ncbi:hypothetical protein Tco_0650783 [Tanacetum coccineum]
MCTYLKNMEGKKLKDLKSRSFDSIQKMFDKSFKRVNTFVDFKADLVEDTSELQSLMEVIPDEEEVAIDDVPLATKSPSNCLTGRIQRRKEKLLSNSES